MFAARPLALALVAAAGLFASACAGPGRPVSPGPPGGDPFGRLVALSRDFGPAPASQKVAVPVALRDGVTGTEVARLAGLVGDHGATLDWSPGQAWASIEGPAPAVGAALGVSVHEYMARSGTRFYAAATDARPAGLPAVADLPIRVSSYPSRHPAAVRAGGLTAVDLVTAYGLKPLRDLGLDGSGTTVSFLEIDGYQQGDLDRFSQKFGLPIVHPTQKMGRNLKQEGETIMDLEVVHEIVPGAALQIYSVDQASSTAGSDFLKAEQRMIADNPGGVVSVSLGACEESSGASEVAAEQKIYDAAIAAGVTILVSTGDSGAFTCLNDDFGAVPGADYVGASVPAVYPSVTAVGGTRISVASDGSWVNEVVWEEPAETGGTGGNVSTFVTQPSWQRGPGVESQLNPRHMRSIPDVSADADPISGAAMYADGAWGQGGGTSQAAPIWAGVIVLANQYLGKRGLKPAGFVNPALYAIAAGSPPYPAFHDIVVGTNLVYPATPGYDLATGLGTPDGYNLARDLEAYQRNGGRI